MLPCVFGTVVNDIAQYVTNSFACSGGKFPGMSIAVVKNGQVIYAEGFGKKNQNSTDPVTSNTLFGIGGLTKAFTALLLSDQMKRYVQY